MLANLKKLRQEAGLSQKSLAEAVGISQQSINKYENHNIEPDIETLIRIADYFETSVDYVIGHAATSTQPIAEVSALCKSEASLIRKYRMISPDRQKIVQAVLDSYL